MRLCSGRSDTGAGREHACYGDAATRRVAASPCDCLYSSTVVSRKPYITTLPVSAVLERVPPMEL